MCGGGLRRSSRCLATQTGVEFINERSAASRNILERLPRLDRAIANPPYKVLDFILAGSFGVHTLDQVKIVTDALWAQPIVSWHMIEIDAAHMVAVSLL